MQYVILGVLLGGPLSLYDVRKRFSAGISLFYSASLGSLQRALQQLVADGSVTVADAVGDARGKKLHSVTERGRERWRRWMLAPVPDGGDAEKVVLAKVYLLGRLDDPRDRAAVLTALRARVADAEAGLRTLEHAVDAAAHGVADADRAVFAYQRATLDYGLRAHGLLLAWLDELAEPRA